LRGFDFLCVYFSEPVPMILMSIYVFMINRNNNNYY